MPAETGALRLSVFQRVSLWFRNLTPTPYVIGHPLPWIQDPHERGIRCGVQACIQIPIKRRHIAA
jgi:hypothetical protein